MAIKAKFFIMEAGYPVSRPMKRTKHGAAVALFLLAAACGAEPQAEGTREVSIEDVLADPAAHDGQRLRFRAAYVGSFERSVLTAALAESYPPQPAEPTIWVDGRPSRDCVISDAGVTWGDVIAEGVFRYDEEGGFGDLGVYTMQLTAARLSCP